MARLHDTRTHPTTITVEIDTRDNPFVVDLFEIRWTEGTSSGMSGAITLGREEVDRLAAALNEHRQIREHRGGELP